MGEARRRSLGLRKLPCWCGSGRVAGECCFQGDRWFKPSATISLRTFSNDMGIEKCYMKELRACEGGISGEHLVSESVIRLIAGDGKIIVGGTPWLKEGETKTVGFKSLTANCLCQRHNSDLSPLDTAMRDLFAVLKADLEKTADASNFIASGHDLERWLLKTLKALAVSQNLARGRIKLAGKFASDVRIFEMLENPLAWPEGTGLYCPMKVGDTTVNHNRFQISPITNSDEEICGLWTSVFGINFILVLDAAMLTGIPQLANAVFRPKAFKIRQPTAAYEILISWSDGKRHRGEITLEYVRDIDKP